MVGSRSTFNPASVPAQNLQFSTLQARIQLHFMDGPLPENIFVPAINVRGLQWST
jgi:hypothetical protein